MRRTPLATVATLAGIAALAALAAAPVAAQTPAQVEAARQQEAAAARALEEGRLDEAIAGFQAALAVTPQSAAAHRALGYALDKQGSTEEAVEAYRAALEAAPGAGDAVTLNNLGVALEKLGRFEEAIDAMEQALEADPDDANARKNLETMRRNEVERQRRTAELDAAKRAAEARPDDPRAAYALARVQAHQGDADAALETLARALQLGYRDRAALADDPAFQALRQDPRYREVVAAR